ncbi:neuronal acetylcholine receptor subunit alpha-7-like [Panonychus citri]|uniref:neuronal acetylcholine receptor subunit alpha-7-like n=1 Tax=Panonychus citri TaxID=50023 RepID=UPI0023072B33|nr:neuronal acetylcholine receptor subunit alpha-7-like [Panonychus citri]
MINGQVNYLNIFIYNLIQYFVMINLLSLIKVDCSQNERRLLQDLLNSYDPLERPVNNETDTLVVTLGITYQQIIKLNEKEQLLVSNIWLQMSWTDINLTWNASNYGGLTSLRIPSSKIWKPDLLLYNSADPRFDSTYPTNVVVQSNGSTFYMPPGVFTSTCKIDITWFPFDDQLCKLKFGSWSYDMSQVDLDVIGTQGDLSTYIENGEWILLGIPGRRNEVLYRCCADPFSDVTYTIHIRRRTLYYGINLIIPCLIISSMTLLGFTLPPDSGEKLTLGVTILLSMTVFLLQLTETLPATSDTVSAIATYFASIMLMVAFSVVMTVVVLNFHYKSSEAHELNPMLKKLILHWLAFILGVKRPRSVKQPNTTSTSPPTHRFTSKVYSINRDDLPINTTSLSSPPSPNHNHHHHHHVNHNQHHQQYCSECGYHQNLITGLSPFSSSNHPNHQLSSAHQILSSNNVNNSLPNLINHHHNQMMMCISCRKSLLSHSGGGGGGGINGGVVNCDDEDDCIRAENDDKLSHLHHHCDHNNYHGFHNNNNDEENNIFHHHHPSSSSPPHILPPPPPPPPLKTSSHCACHGKQLDDILNEIQFMTNRIRKEDHVIEILDDWKFAAIVIDRLCFVMFSTFSIISSSICFMSAPHLIV